MIQQARDECGPLPDSAVLSAQDRHRQYVGCLALAEALHEGLSLLAGAER